MTDGYNQITWFVSRGGYQWRSMRPLKTEIGPLDNRSAKYISDLVAEGSQVDVRAYAPLSNTGLFLQFADLDPSQEDIKTFVSEFGLLTRGEPLQLESSSGRSHITRGESLRFWREEIGNLRRAVELWTALRDGATDVIARRVRWDGSWAVAYHDESLRMWIAAEEFSPELLRIFPPGNIVKPAWHALLRIVNAKLQDTASPQLRWASSDMTRPALYQCPRDLLSALWLQFARAIDGKRAYARCQECRNRFEINSPDGSRSDKQFCTTACRARNWRKRRKGQQS